MTEYQFQEALRLLNSGMSQRRVAEAIGVTKGALSNKICSRGLQSGRGAKPTVLTDEQVADAIERHKSGQTWSEIARSLGVGRTTLCHRTVVREAVVSDTARGLKRSAYSAVEIERHEPRAVRRVIQSKEVVRDLARQFASGAISRAEFVMGIRV